MRTAHLFAGVGGGLLADLILGHTSVLAVEWDEYCCAVLEDRAEDGWFPGLEVHCGDIREFDFAPWRGRVDCIAAGFPCQDISAAGRGAGIRGERSGLFFEVMRAVDAIRPAYVFLENSPHIRTKGRDVVIAELVARGYAWRDGKIGAVAVGAPHKRDRWFCLAANPDSSAIRLQPGWGARAGRQKAVFARDATPDADSGRDEAKPHERISELDEEVIRALRQYTRANEWAWPFVGNGCGMVHGLSAKSHRIKALGNAQVPLQAAAAWLILSQ